MLENIESILRDSCRLDASQPILVGVSGGPDSLCLMDVLHRSGYRIIVAHFNHKLRLEADSEANEVERLARDSNLPFVSASEDVRAQAEAEALSIEEAARKDPF